MSAPELSVHVFLQMFIILAACRVVGLVARRCGQPLVVGEMVAGGLLGPSLLGWLAPEGQVCLFPAESLRVLFVLAQVGIGVDVRGHPTQFGHQPVEGHRMRRSSGNIDPAG